MTHTTKTLRHSVTLPDGQVATRNSKTMHYSHVVVCMVPEAKAHQEAQTDLDFWTGRLAALTTDNPEDVATYGRRVRDAQARLDAVEGDSFSVWRWSQTWDAAAKARDGFQRRCPGYRFSVRAVEAVR